MRLKRAGVHFYIIGLVTLTLGIALAVESALGTSPFDALLVGLFRTFGLSIGSWEIVVGFAMVLANALLERKRPEYFALLTSFAIGVGIDSWLFIIRLFGSPEMWLSQWVYLIISLLLNGIGIAIYLQSKVAVNPMDRSMLVVSKLTGLTVTYSRAIINIILVIAAFLMGGAIGIGTLLNALFVGLVISHSLPYMQRLRAADLARLESPGEHIAK